MADLVSIAQIVKVNLLLPFYIFFVLIYFFFIKNESISQEFLDCIDDVPLLEKLYESNGSCFHFDSDEGRVANVEATGFIEKYELFAYYKDILPQLGWQINESASQSILKFNRGKEMLRITVSKAENKIVVIFFSILLANQ